MHRQRQARQLSMSGNCGAGFATQKCRFGVDAKKFHTEADADRTTPEHVTFRNINERQLTASWYTFDT